MCGIFGVMARDGVADHARFCPLAARNTERGNLGFGGALISHDSESIFHEPGPLDVAKIPPIDVPIRIGHVRAPTAGRNDDRRELHPFATRDLLLAHNGLLLNHAQFAGWNPTPDIAVDSLVIIGGVQRHLDEMQPIIEAIRATIEQLDGQQACWLWHRPEQALYVWRVMSPIYVGQSDREVWFSSIKDESTPDRLDEGVIYRLNGLRFESVGTFDFYSPYR